MMVRRRVLSLIAAALLASLLVAAPVLAARPLRLVPAEEGKIALMLKAQGVIPAGATQDEVDRMVQAYLAKKLAKSQDWVNPKAAAKLAAQEAAGEPGNLLKGKKLGNLVTADPAVDVPYGAPQETAKILMLLVEFSDPIHNQLPAPDRAVDNTSYWVSDFNTQHYQNMLYDRTPDALSMANYYLQQSNGLFTVEGQAYGWYHVNEPEYVYGRDTTDNNDNALKNPVELIRDLLTELEAEGRINEIPWADYDQDHDGIIDHIMIIHAGAGQEGGGGVQGDDAIWSHSSTADPMSGGMPIPGTDLRIGPYTMMPEDGAIGVFAHEFGHDLGLPDEYDTIYSGEASPAFWSLMASGSWLGDDQALGTVPSSISIWGRYALGWVTPDVVTLDELKTGPLTFKLDHSNHLAGGSQAIRVSLPKKSVTTSVNVPYSGANEWWSGMGNELDLRLTRVFDLTGVTSAHLSFMTWYDIEKDWDYGYVEVSTDGGTTWTSLPSSLTTNDNPNSQNFGNGITGSSGGWVPASFDLTPFCGSEIQLRFRYWTDVAAQGAGFCVDDLSIPEIGFFDNVESGNQAGWVTSAGPNSTSGEWTIFAGSSTKPVNHYYILEWRDFTYFDNSLKNCYNYFDTSNWAERYSYNPGLLLWYRDMAYTDNWVGNHPGRGFLLLVDSHATILKSPVTGAPLRTRVQIMDAPFGVERTVQNTLTRFGQTKTYQPLSAVPTFADKQSYLNPSYPVPGTLLTTYGLGFRVLGAASDDSSAVVSIFLK